MCEPGEFLNFVLIAALKSLDVTKLGITSCQTQFENIIPYLKPMINTVQLQGEVVDTLMKECFANPTLHDMFKPSMMSLYKAQVIDGNVIIAWYERAQGSGKVAFGKQMFKFVEWLKE